MHPRRLALGGVALAAAVALTGLALEAGRLGMNDAASARKVETYVRARFAAMTASLQRVANDVASSDVVRRRMRSAADDQAARVLFDEAERALRPDASALAPDAITIYTQDGAARAWAGRPSDIPRERIGAPAALFVTPSPLGLRLVYVQPILAPAGETARVGAVAVEQVLSPAPTASTITATDFYMPTPIAPVSLRTEGAGELSRGGFVMTAPDGKPLLQASVSAEAVDQARRLWRRRVTAAVIVVLAITLLTMAGPLLDRRAVARRVADEVALTAAVIAIAVGGCALLWLAFEMAAAPAWRSSVAVLLGSLCTMAAVGALATELTRLRVAWRRARRGPGEAPLAFGVTQLLCGTAIALLLVGFARLLASTVDPLSIDLRHVSLHPWTPTRLALLAGIVLWEVSALWAGALIAAVGLARWRLPRAWSRWHVAAAACWFAPIAAVALIASAHDSAIPAAGVLLGGAACIIAALVAARTSAWYRRTTVASRILALLVAFLVPALLLYPSADFLSERATRRLITSRYAVEAMEYARTLQEQLNTALNEIDQLSVLPALVTGTSNDTLTGLRTDSAFLIWSQTTLARTRLTSGIELYDRKGALVSRFALNFPEYTGAAQRPESVAGCRWDIFGEALPFGSEDRRTLHAQRNICADGETVGTIVVHVVFDFRALPFITSQNPYFAVFRTGGSPEGTAAADIETAIYGWALGPIYASGRSAWAINEELFARIYHTRESFWTTLEKQGVTWRVYVSNNREGIYAIGYPVPSLFDGFVRLAELTTFSGALYVVLLLGAAVFTRVARARPLVGRALLREIRASFYRKLFLAFVLASIIPVLTLAFVIRAYFANLLLAGVQAEAARTAAVAQRVIEESDAMLRRSSEPTAPFGDDVLVWISQVIDQDVNVFEGPQLFGTSERDLFSSGLLPKRTPEDVYRAIVLDRLPSYVTEDTIGTFSYMLAATPVRVEGRPRILTVPLGTRQQEIEREIDDLDRGIHLAALFFILLGAAIGLSMAERIADPVSRLTRATRHIARGDFDERIAVRSSDELRRLVDAFNSMAAELKTQRAQLERTHRLEAWAEMARQVAHEIKNPLTPIQLSAEHLRRVHADRGEPLGPVLEGCVDAILGQVKLLRQIAAEFSSFASAPTARPSRVDPVDLVRSVIEPYRAGLEGRVEVQNRVAPPLPAVFVDRTLAARALANVVENALHAMPGAGRLALGAAVEDGFVAIRIEDTGVGMDQEALERVFEPYFSTKTTGTGLGLPIARRNVELNGGSIDVASEKGRGTTVTIRLPVAGA